MFATTKLRKPRHQKTFNDKFVITVDKIKPSMDTLISKKISDYLQIHKLSYSDISHDNVQNMLSDLNLYHGVFYINPDYANWKMLNLNIENVYQDVVKLNKQDHKDNDWAYENDEFQKVYVLANDGEEAIIAITYNDSFSPFLFQTINTINIYFEGNMAKHILSVD